jgi:DNA helicase-2/ATP-dependent DNA helicase PcrA
MKSTDERIAQSLRAGQSFVLDAGAGSGKTTSLVNALTLLRNEFRGELVSKRQQVACITYTNVAVDEIVCRTERDPLFRVSTIHNFLWHLVKPYQKELREALLKYNEELDQNSRRKEDQEELADAIEEIEEIVYSDRGTNFLEGRIFHDDLIGISAIMFRDYPLLSRLAGYKFPFILVDEYQDTVAEVVEILLDGIRFQSPDLVVGFFGDKKQAIYDKVIGEVPAKYDEILERITKEENYRCSIAVIGLLNRLRTDIHQFPAGDNVPGAAVYVGFSRHEDGSAEEAFSIALDRLVDPPTFENARVLYLTHRLIASKAGYIDLFNTYNRLASRYVFNQFLSGDDTIVRFLAFEVDLLASAWAQGDAGVALSILERNGFSLQGYSQKKTVSEALDKLVRLIDEGRKIGDILHHIDLNQLLGIPDQVSEGFVLASVDEGEVAEKNKRYRKMFQALLQVEAKQVRLYRKMLEDNSPFTTKHGVKGDEFDTVVVVLNDRGARWTKYSFGNLLAGTDTSQDRFERTSNLFYVCCSRARKNLVVVDLDHNPDCRDAIERLFGSENVILVQE